MRFLRAFLRDHRRLAWALVALALCMKAIVPSGFMLNGAGRSLTITICGESGAHAIDRATQILVVKSGKTHDDRGEPGNTPDMCPYSGLAMAALSGADVPLLALALGFILAHGLLPLAIPAPARRAFVTPPQRGPPTRG